MIRMTIRKVKGFGGIFMVSLVKYVDPRAFISITTLDIYVYKLIISANLFFVL